MKNFIVAGTLLLACACTKPEALTVEQAIAEPQRYEGARIEIVGWSNAGEGAVLCATADAARSFDEKCIRILSCPAESERSWPCKLNDKIEVYETVKAGGRVRVRGEFRRHQTMFFLHSEDLVSRAD
jgi:hypothetical protein